MDERLLWEMQDMLLLCNRLVRLFRQHMQIPADEAPNFILVIDERGNMDLRRYNAPTGLGGGQIAGIIPGS
jgi:hypothetical protein